MPTGKSSKSNTPARKLSTYKQRLSASSFLPDEDDYLLMQGRPNREPGVRFLGRYREHSIYKTFDNYGMTQKVLKLGFEQIEVRILPTDQDRQRLKILALKDGQVVLLSDIIVRVDSQLGLDTELAPDLLENKFNALIIQWIRLQNPLASFTRERPALPGQQYPGLGIGNSTKTMLVGMAVYNDFQLITNAPEFVHNALMYHPDFLFLDPRKEGQLRALWRDLSAYGLANISWAAYLGCLRLNGETYEWTHGQQIRPLCKKLEAHFKAATYLQQVEAEMARCHFTFDQEQYDGIAPLDENGCARISPEEMAGP